MTPVIPATASNVPLIPGIAFSIRRNNCSMRCSSTRKWVKSTSLSNPCILPLSTSLKLFPQFSRGCFLHDKSRIIRISATGTDVAVEEQDSLGADEVSGGKSEATSNAVNTANEEAPAKSEGSPPSAQQRRARPSRKSEMPPVKNEELIPGAIFTGKVRSIQPFGAFVDFGGFTDGLVHVSQLSDSFVKDVGSFVSVGQEVKVRLLEANTETGRISLTMRESDDGSKKQQQKDSPSSSDKSRPSTKSSPKSGQKRDEIKKTSKFVKGQDLDGTVKNITRSGSFISLPEGEEGFLPSSEESHEGFVNMMGGSSLQIGQEVKVRVLRINRGRVTLTMKKEEDNIELDFQLSQGVVHTATNPFVLAFRKNKEIAAFLDQKEKVEKSEMADGKPVTLTTSEEAEEKSDKSDAMPDVSEQVGQLTDSVEATTTVPSSTDEKLIEAASKVDDDSADGNKDDKQIAGMLSNTSEAVVDEVQIKEEEAEGSSEVESTLSSTSEVVVDEVKTEGKEAKRSAEAESALSSTSKAVDVEVQPEEKEVEAGAGAENTMSSTSEAVVDDVQTDKKEAEAGAEAESTLSSTSEAVIDEVQTEEKEAKQTAETESTLSSTSEAVVDEAQTKEEDAEGSSEAERTLSSTSEAVVDEVKTDEKEAEVSAEAESTLSSTSEAVLDEVKTEEKEAEQIAETESMLSGTSEVVVDTAQTKEEDAEGSSEAERTLLSTSEAVADEVKTDEKEAEVGIEAERRSSSPSEAVVDEVQSEEKEANQTAEAETMLTSTSGAAVDEAQPKEEEAEGSSESESKSSSTSELVVGEVQTEEEKTDGTSETLTPKENEQTNNVIVEEVRPKDESESAAKLESSPESFSQISSSESLAGNGVVEIESDTIIAKSEELTKPLAVEDEIPAAPAVEGNSEKPSIDENESITSSTEKSEDTPSEEVKAEEPKPIAGSQTIEETPEEQTSSAKSEAETPSVTGAEVPSAGGIKNENGTPAAEGNGSVSSSNGKAAPAPEKSKTKASVSPALVKQLREETGAGMMDCKKALAETGGDIVKAQEFLRKKGLASAEKKASRVTAEGRIGSYIHDSRIGVLVEVNCETDFVSRGEIFKELVDDLAMQVAACPQVEYLVPEDVPKDFVSKEREIEMQKEDLQSKPEQIRSKIVEGRIQKRLDELALLEQPYIKNDKVVVKDFVKQTIATIGENIKVKRFVRFNLGEGLEKKSQDFAAEVAAQTAAKAAAPPKKEPAPAETTETVKKPPTVAVSAALVKQLREETGAGMMDCKKALSETGGDLEKAQEYLRKKGLSTADKKSSRLAAEGRIGSYIHDSRIGVLIEVNCETDFVGRSERFKELVDDLAMQVVACPQVQFVSIEDISEDILKKEKDIEMQREDLQSKPENIREKIVEGRVKKRLGELALLEQPFIKDDSILVKDLVKQTVAALGENIKVRRFVKFTLGETNEDAN